MWKSAVCTVTNEFLFSVSMALTLANKLKPNDFGFMPKFMFPQNSGFIVEKLCEKKIINIFKLCIWDVGCFLYISLFSTFAIVPRSYSKSD